MGLLDDAIRQHLELKRLRGADPSVVAREEQDALGPVRRDVEGGGREGSGGEVSSGFDESFLPYPEPASVADVSPAGQETIEINMEAELTAQTDSDEPEAKHTAPAARPAHTQPTTEESLEWEVPSDRDDPAGRSGSEGNEDSHARGDQEDALEHVEDVLEETPDFLRDTPEQERLWFEQRPPRDFDFNE